MGPEANVIDNVDFGFIMLLVLVAISAAGLVWWMLNGQSDR